MPSPLLQLRIPQDLADWLEAKYPSRGEVAAYVRELLTAEQMKEAVAPLVPADEVDWQAMALRRPIPTNAEFDAHKAKPKRPFRCPDCLDPTPHERGDCPAYQISEPKPKARRKKSYEVAPTPEFSITTNSVQTPARCNRGACTGTINPVSGRCLHCNQTPLKESK